MRSLNQNYAQNYARKIKNLATTRVLAVLPGGSTPLVSTKSRTRQPQRLGGFSLVYQGFAAPAKREQLPRGGRKKRQKGAKIPHDFRTELRTKFYRVIDSCFSADIMAVGGVNYVT